MTTTGRSPFGPFEPSRRPARAGEKVAKIDPHSSIHRDRDPGSSRMEARLGYVDRYNSSPQEKLGQLALNFQAVDDVSPRQDIVGRGVFRVGLQHRLQNL